MVQKRWKTLRERYTKEHKKMKNKRGKSSDSADDVVVKEWEHYQLTSFLQEFIKHRKFIYTW